MRSAPPTTRVVLLGASNLTRALPLVIALVRATFGERLELLIAHGHGRSYGQTSSLLGRELPGIRQCRLWEQLDETETLPTYALLTDIGNDLLYGASVAMIADWIEQCLQDLTRIHARISITRLPLATLDTLPEWRFRLLRTILFPNSRHSLAQIISAAYALDQRIQSFSAAYSLALLPSSPEWYGFDAIHIVRSRRRAVWQHFLQPWLGTQPLPPRIQPEAWWLPLLPPADSVWFGMTAQRPQPALQLRGQSRLFLY